MRLFLLIGSLRENSLTASFANVFASECKELGWSIDLFSGSDLLLPMADPAFHHNPQDHPDERIPQLCDRVRQSDAVLLATPVYHGSFSGVLKNTLDHIEWDAFRGKPIGAIAHGGSNMPGSSVCDHLRAVVRTMAGYALQTQIVTGRGDFENNEASSAIRDRAVRMASEIDTMASLLKTSVRPENPMG